MWFLEHTSLTSNYVNSKENIDKKVKKNEPGEFVNGPCIYLSIVTCPNFIITWEKNVKLPTEI